LIARQNLSFIIISTKPVDISGAGLSVKYTVTLLIYGQMAVPEGQKPKLHDPETNPILLPNKYESPGIAIVLPLLLLKSFDA